MSQPPAPASDAPRVGVWLRRALGVELPPADQDRYRDTAAADTKVIVGHRSVVVLVAAVALAGTEASAFLSSNELTTLEKIVLAALAAGVGVLLILIPVIYVASLAAAPHRQNGYRKRREAAAVQELVTAATQESTRSQYAAAIRAGQHFAPDGLRQPSERRLAIEWMAQSLALVRETRGELAAALVATTDNLPFRRKRLEDVAAELARDDDPGKPSQAWETYVHGYIENVWAVLTSQISSGETFRADMIAGESWADEQLRDAWLREADETIAMAPAFELLATAALPGDYLRAHQDGLSDELVELLVPLDTKLGVLRGLARRIQPYVGALGVDTRNVP